MTLTNELLLRFVYTGPSAGFGQCALVTTYHFAFPLEKNRLVSYFASGGLPWLFARQIFDSNLELQPITASL